MPYIQEVCVAGKTIEIEKRYSSRYGKKYLRVEGKIDPTPESMKIINERNAIKKLRRLLNTNFKHKDIHLCLKYRKECRPEEPAKAKKDLEKFLRKLRKIYKDEGKELKYIHTTEYKRSAIHHHLVINNVDMSKSLESKIIDIWDQGRPWFVYLDEDGQYNDLAVYIVKETKKTFKEDGVTKKRWCQSKNMKKPEVDITVVKRNSFRNEPQAFKGYIIETDMIKKGVHEVTGCEFQFYSMRQIE